MDIIFFESPAELRAWFEANHDTAKELFVGYYKKGSGKPSITWEESVDQALCFGWIDGVRKRIDDESYKIRFTPRKPRSIWSAVNIKRMEDLSARDLVKPSGLIAFEQRSGERSEVYSYEQENLKLDEADEALFRANIPAWEFFQTTAPSYQKAAIWWVVSAKKAETRQKRLSTLIEDSANSKTLPQFTRRT
jgi:uncharacterized protein YdeI (YjbR/CyaY-like superfamily)